MVDKIKIKVDALDVWFESTISLQGINLEIRKNEILGIIGPANSGKSTFLRCLNRFNDLSQKFRMQGKVLIDEKDIYSDKNVGLLRKKVGIVFALPIVLPLSIYENVVYGPRRHGIKDKSTLDALVEKTLKESYLWDEVKDRLQISGLRLSGGQQQRLCLARTLAVDPEIILYDEPCSGLDPISTAKIEEAMFKFKEKYTQVLVTNNTKQAARVSDRTALFLLGKLIEIGLTEKLFTSPSDQRTNDYISGRFG